MSNSLSKLVFSDGDEWFTYGDHSVIVLDRIYRTPDEAIRAYKNEEPVVDRELLQAMPEPVWCETQYGSGDWVDMLTQNATACRRSKLIITRPHHTEPRNFWGYDDADN